MLHYAGIALQPIMLFIMLAYLTQAYSFPTGLTETYFSGITSYYNIQNLFIFKLHVGVSRRHYLRRGSRSLKGAINEVYFYISYKLHNSLILMYD